MAYVHSILIFTDAENSNDKAASITRLSHDKDFRKLLGTIEEIIFKEDNGDSRLYNWSHPKMEHLVSVVSEHFEMKAKDGESTKAIIFCQYRLVVTEVYEIIKKFVPLAKPVMFIGQSSKEKGQGLPQKKQIEVMKQFRAGEFNVLIATSVAEEGLDIGDVDLIVSMETHRSPIKLVQRFGRTGRKRSGRCVVLLTSGVEVRKFNEVMSTQKNYSSIISAPGVRASLEENSPRMVPQNCNPKLQLLHIKVQKLDKRKQCDIRNVFGKLDTSRTYPSTSAAAAASTSAAAAPHVPASAFLTDAELAQVRDELGSYFPNFDRLPASCELWPRQKGPRLEIEEFASDKFSRYSDWLDWNSDLQQTHVVGHSRDTNMLVHLLQKATEIRERTDRSDEPVVHDPISSPPASLWSTVGGANQNQRRKNEGVKKTTKTSARNQPKSKHGLDIRECMAKVAPKLGLYHRIQQSIMFPTEKIRLTSKMFKQSTRKMM
ncbi:Fanconi anemia group M protein homolog isoform X2 [Nilaparvata lugens]|uniref:Fanconi anemia group M protein homolog isoform X2 n=1 Tax=Nilaparvata lugens TaxID=108931 RepID=UPI00193D7EE6|nr:Fanconi anemia group M protein homolog isoform X2 [Nilaparvata lugens]